MDKTTPTTLATLKKTNGNDTTTWKESAKLLMEELIPKNKEEEETEEEQRMRARMKEILDQTVTEENDNKEEITVKNFEIDQIIKSLKNKKAQGPLINPVPGKAPHRMLEAGKIPGRMEGRQPNNLFENQGEAKV